MLKSDARGLSGLDLEPVSSRRTVQDGVYQRLSHALMSGALDPGQQLTIASLSELCGTSHMPVREALRRLAAENALEVASTGTAFVPAVSRARLDDLCDARSIVEGAAGARAAPHFGPRDVRRLEQLIAEHIEAAEERDLAGMTTKNQEFHFALYRASGSPVLVRIIETLWLQFGPYLRMLTRHIEPQLATGDSDTYTRHHFEIVEALKRGDAAAVGRCVVADIETTRAMLRPLAGGVESR